jgi:hypothetical protein
MVLVGLVFLGVDIQTQLIPVAGAILSLSFMFGDALRMLVDCYLLVYVVRPYDIGDKICLQGTCLFFIFF